MSGPRLTCGPLRPVTSGHRYGEALARMPKTLRGIGYRNSFASGVGSGSGLARGVRALNGFHEDEADPGRLLVLPATSTAFDGGAE